MKDVTDFERKLGDFVELSTGNLISKQQAISDQVVGLRLYDRPLAASASVSDPLFLDLKKEGAIGPHFRTPLEWWEEGKSVISFFLPYTKQIKEANRLSRKEPALEWLYGRVEGQEFLTQVCGHLKSLLEAEGGKVFVPAWDPLFWKTESPKGVESEEYEFTSNWSERHVGFVCGLGTFGLSRGLITKAGIAGRLASVITDLEFEPTGREYTDLYEYCSKCGACVKRCPVNAISLERGKEHRPCGKFMDDTKKKYAPRYGCGKCQTGVPCESRIPAK